MNVSFAPLEPDVAAFLGRMTGISFAAADFTHPRWFCCTARDDNGVIMGALACEFRHWFDAHFNVAIANPRCLSHRLLRAIFTALFSQAVRVSAEIDPANGRAMRQAARMGFKVEGFLRKGFDGQRDALVYGMLAEDCRYLIAPRSPRSRLHREARHGQGSTTA